LDDDSEENFTGELARQVPASKNSRFTALVEGLSKDNPLVWEARLEGMAPDIDGKLDLTDIELPSGENAQTGEVVRVDIAKADAYDLIGRVIEIMPRPGEHSGVAAAIPPATGAEKLHRIATGAPLRVLG